MGKPVARSNPMRVAETAPLLAYWGDLHGQSRETAGSGTAEQYFAFARDKAFVDIAGHSANDFAMTDEFWEHLNDITKSFNAPGKFVTLPGYEWSGNTAVGGDRNVFYMHENEPIHRSSRILSQGGSRSNTDCLHVRDLFNTLRDRDAVVIAHVGGRYAELSEGHDTIETAVEIHSIWGTFEWILHDAFDLGYRVGVVCHSDDHKGRPGAARSGAGVFVANGGLTCYRMAELTRENLVDALRRRHHYGTTGVRVFLDVQGKFGEPVMLSVGQSRSRVTEVMMGDIVEADGIPMHLEIDVVGHAPIEKVTIFNGRDPIETIRPYASAEAGKRIRLLWEGASARGRGRHAPWKGGARVIGNHLDRMEPVNFLRPDRPIVVADGGNEVCWDSVTAGQKMGVDLFLAEPDQGEIVIDTNRVSATLPVADITTEGTVLDAGGLGLQMAVTRLPDANPHFAMKVTRAVNGIAGRDNPIYVRVTFEDGNQAWSSPIYLVPAGDG